MKVLGAAVAGEVGKKVAEHVAKEARKAVAQPAAKAALKRAATAAAPAAAALVRALPVVGGIAATLYVGGIVLDSQRKKEAALWAAHQLEKTARGVKDLTPATAATLWRQYYDFALKRPVQNPYLGK